MASEKPFDEIDFALMLMTAIVPPHWPWAILLTTQAIVRRSPRATAHILDAVGWKADDAPAWLLPGAQKLLTDERPAALRMPSRRSRAAVKAPATPRHATASTAERPRWLEMVNDSPDATPHALILGGSGAGKTTMATAILGDRGGRAVVLTPKVSPSNWRGAEVVTLDDDGSYAPIEAAITDLEDEKRRRIVTLRREGREALEPLTVVLDELVDLTSRVPAAGDLMVNLSSIGREINMRLIGVGTTDDALGIKGWKASRNNYVRIEMDEQRRATISHGKRSVAVQARESLALSRAASLAPWRGEPEYAPVPPLHTSRPIRAVAADVPRSVVVTERVPERPAPPDDLLASLLALPADVRAAVPDLSPERAERLARALAARRVPAHQDAIGTAQRSVPETSDRNGTERSSVTVETGTGGAVEVNVTQVTASGRGRTMPRAGGIDMRSRRRLAAYRKAGADGRSFRSVFSELGGSKDPAFRAWQEGKAQKEKA